MLVSDQHSDCLLVAEDGVRLVLLLMSQHAMNRKSSVMILQMTLNFLIS